MIKQRTPTKDKLSELREKALSDVMFFARMVNPNRHYGEIHEEWLKWLRYGGDTDNKLLLAPRGHMKSHLAAVDVAHEIICDPTITVMYLSATAELCEQQLLAIKQILTCDAVMLLWPELVRPEEAKREKWNQSEIIVDSPLRKEEGTRDYTVAARGVGASTTGLHADLIVLDDIVGPSNAYTEEGRTKVESAYSQLASIKNPGGRVKAVGTRYHPKDIYARLIEMEEDVFDDDGNVVASRPVYEITEAVVENQGVYIWPKARRKDGKYFGFDDRVMARIRAEYLDITQYYAQYYNNPNAAGSNRVDRDKFVYYDQKFVSCKGGIWYFKDRRINLVAAIDFAYTLKKTADFTSIVVIGMDYDKNIYVLDIDRFKTDKISEYYSHLMVMYNKWGFRRLRAECTAAQSIIVKELRDNYIKPNGVVLTIHDFYPTRKDGSKEERISATLESKYDNQTIWHYKGGYCTLLEEEVAMARPPHDDIKDALASAIEIAIPPTMRSNKATVDNNIVYHSRFGGIQYR